MRERCAAAVRWTGILVVGAAAVLAVWADARESAAANHTTVSITPSALNKRIGEEFSLQISVDNVRDLAGFEFRLQFDSNVLQAVKAESLGLIESSGRKASCIPSYGEDYVLFGCVTSGGDPPGVQGGGAVAAFTFRAKGAGTTAVAFAHWNLADRLGDDAWGEDNDGDGRLNEDPPDGIDYDGDGRVDEDGVEPALIKLNAAAVRVLGKNEAEPDSLPATPQPDRAVLRPTPVSAQAAAAGLVLPTGGETGGSQPGDSAAPSGSSGAGGNGPTGNVAGEDVTGAAGGPVAGYGPQQDDDQTGIWRGLSLIMACGGVLFLAGLAISRRAKFTHRR